MEEGASWHVDLAQCEDPVTNGYMYFGEFENPGELPEESQ